MTEPTEEQIQEQIRQLKIDDVLLQTVVTLVNLSGRRLTVDDEKDVDQAKKGIEAVRALLPLCPEEQVGPIREALSQLQMVYVRETQQPAAGETLKNAANERGLNADGLKDVASEVADAFSNNMSGKQEPGNGTSGNPERPATTDPRF